MNFPKVIKYNETFCPSYMDEKGNLLYIWDVASDECITISTSGKKNVLEIHWETFLDNIWMDVSPLEELERSFD